MKPSIRLPLFMFLPLCVATGATLAAWNQHQEIRQAEYQAMADAWPTLSEAGKNRIREGMMDGQISKWEYHPLVKMIMDERGMISISTQLVSLAQGRERLLAVMDQQ